MNTDLAIASLCLSKISGCGIDSELFGVGEASLLAEPLLGIISSRECPGHAFLDTIDQVPSWVSSGRVILSGFHSPLEQQVLRSALRRRGRIIKVLARGMANFRPSTEERELFAAGRMLVVTACPPEVRRTTRKTALARNKLVLALADEIVAPHISQGSPLSSLLENHRAVQIRSTSEPAKA